MLLIEWAGAILRTVCFFTVVDAWDKAVVFRLGKPVRDVDPGLRFHWPLHIEYVMTTNCAWDSSDLPTQSVCTADGEEIAINAVLMHRTRDARKLLVDVGA